MKISTMICVHNAELLLAPCVNSIARLSAEICIALNCCTDGTADVVRNLMKVYPKKIRVFKYDAKIITASNPLAAKLADNDPRAFWTYRNWLLNKCEHRLIFSMEADCILTPHGEQLILAHAKAGVFLGLPTFEITSPTTRTSGWSGQNARFYDRELDGGIRYIHYKKTGIEIPWCSQWDIDSGLHCWGPHYKCFNHDYPALLHYGWSNSSEKGRENCGLPQVPFVEHPPSIIPILSKIKFRGVA